VFALLEEETEEESSLSISSPLATQTPSLVAQESAVFFDVKENSISIEIDESRPYFAETQALVNVLVEALHQQEEVPPLVPVSVPVPVPPPPAFVARVAPPPMAIASSPLVMIEAPPPPPVTIDEIKAAGPDKAVTLVPVETENVDISAPIMSAVEDNDTAKVTSLINKDPKLANYKERLGGNTPLIRATALNYYAMVTLLLDKGANPNLQATRSGDTALHKAVLQQNTKLIELLVMRGANVNVKNSHLATPLASAIRNPSSQDIARLLISNGANVKDQWFKEGYSPLMVIIEHGCSDRLLKEMVFSYGADINAKSKSGMTALHLACKWGYLQLVVFFLLKMVQNVVEVINQKDVAGWTPLMYALCWGHHLADQKNSKLDPAAMEKKTILIKALISQGADVNVMPSDGWCPLFLAIRFGPFSVLEHLLFVLKGDVTVKNQNGDTALHIAAGYAPPKGILEILKFKPNVNAQNNLGDSPLIVSVRLGGIDEVQLLLKYGADRNIKNSKKETAASLAKKSPNKLLRKLF